MTAQDSKERRQLIRGLSFTSTIALVIGGIIGTGVFFKASTMTQQVGSPVLVLAAWAAAGILSLAGALTYAELGGLLPQAGGEYVYLRTAYGDAPAFLYGWMRFFVASGGISALAVGFVTFLSAIVPLNFVWIERVFHPLGSEFHWRFGIREVIAVSVILLFGALNCFHVAFGGRVQTILTTAKVLGIAIIVAGAFFLSRGSSLAHFTAPPHTAAWPGFQAFGAAMLAALWACDGWAFMPMVAGEVKDPARNVPRALIIGVLAVLTLYALTNIAYFYALPASEVASSNSTLFPNALPVATKTAQAFLGTAASKAVSVLFMISALGALNGVLLSMARVPFAMARNGLFFSKFGHLSQDSCVPVWAILILSVWAGLLAISGTFDQLTNFVVFGQWIFYILTTTCVFTLRRRLPDAFRPYRTLGYPVVPLLFILVGLWLLVNTLRTAPLEAVTGLLLISSGVPFYLYYRRGARRQEKAPTEKGYEFAEPI